MRHYFLGMIQHAKPFANHYRIWWVGVRVGVRFWDSINHYRDKKPFGLLVLHDPVNRRGLVGRSPESIPPRFPMVGNRLGLGKAPTGLLIDAVCMPTYFLPSSPPFPAQYLECELELCRQCQDSHTYMSIERKSCVVSSPSF